MDSGCCEGGRSKVRGGGWRRIAVVLCQGTQSEPSARKTRESGAGRPGDVYRGCGEFGVATQTRRRRGPAASLGGARRRGHWTAALVVLVRGSMCENSVKPEKGSGGPEMRRRRAITVRSKLTVAALRRKSRPLQVLGSCGEASGSLLASRRGLCAAPVGLGGSRATRPRWRRELCSALSVEGCGD